MPSVNYPVFFFRVSNLLEYVKWEVFLICTDKSHRHQRHEPLEGSETCSLRKFWNLDVLRGQTLSKMFRFHACFHVHDLHTITPISGVHHCTRNYRRLMLGYQKGKNGWVTTEKRPRIMLKKTGWMKKTLSFFG